MAGDAVSEAAWQAWSEASQRLMARAVEAVRAGQMPDSAEAQAEIAAWMRECAGALGRKPDRAFACWVHDHFTSSHHPKIDRYWELVAQLKGMPYSPAHAQAFHWLMAGLRSMTTDTKTTNRGSQ